MSMASNKSLVYWASRMGRLSPDRNFASSSSSGWNLFGSPQARSRWKLRGDFMPVYICLGLISGVLLIGTYTIKHQLAYSPNVFVSKKRREGVPEVDEPEWVVDTADKFISKSVFRKMAHVQDMDATRAGIKDPVRPDPFTRPRTAMTLKSAGVDTRENQPMENK